MFDGLDNSGSKLDAIVADGLKRIDEAVERVIDADCWVDVDLSADELERIVDQQFWKADRMIGGNTYRGRYNAQLRADQRELNANMSRMADRAAQLGGVMNIGDQSAFGSPLNQLGAAYRNAFGRM